MKSSYILSTQEVTSLLAQELAAKLIDVRLADDFEREHIPGAIHAAVLQVSFFKQLAQAGISKDTPFIVYGHNKNSYEARHACDKLQRAGFTEVKEYRGGLSAWKYEGNQTQGNGEAPPEPDDLSGKYLVNLEESKARWQGRNLLNKHFGHLPLSSGEVLFEEGELIGGEFTLDLTKLSCDDLSEEQGASMLIGHLQNEDFFDVANFPEAKFSIALSEVAEEDENGLQLAPGAINLIVYGELTLRGKTQPLSFPLSAGIDENGRPCAQAMIEFDRTMWGAIYGSGKFFQRAAMHLVNDQVELDVKIVAEKEIS